jgi:hypothetical protein
MLYTNGSKGNVVRQIQAKVGAQVTGVWDTLTYRKVYEYQKANSLHQTGEVNEETYNHMFPPKVVKPKLKAEKVAQPTKKTYSEENTKKQKEDGTTKL